jgi:hypothetical protein
VISKLCVHKCLEIKILQNSIYGRLAVDGTLAPEVTRGFESHLVKPDAKERRGSRMVAASLKKANANRQVGRLGLTGHYLIEIVDYVPRGPVLNKCPDPPNAMPVMPLNAKTVDPRSRRYIGLPSITAVPVGDFVRTVWVSLKPADR